MGEPHEAVPAGGTGPAEQHRLELPAVPRRHQRVQDRVEGGGEEVEAAGEVEEVLVDCAEGLVLPEVDVAEALEVEGGPGDEEQDDHGHWGAGSGRGSGTGRCPVFIFLHFYIVQEV